MQLIAYVRVSSTIQLDGFGLDAQEKACRSWARANGHRIVRVVREEAVRGTVAAPDRPGLADVLAAVKRPRYGERREADAILVPRLDRLARALTVQEATLALVWREESHLFTAETGEVLRDDPDDPMRTAMRQMAGVFAQLDRAMTVKRLRDGRVAKAEAGRKATGAYAYGYRGAGKGRERDAAPDPAEQAALARMVALRTDGASYRQIAAALDADGIPTRRNASGWSPVAVRAIVLREVAL
ncbi:MAG TPA: recombinase family protein [Sporichthyaceae bacterium]